jgi:hypothetical protein
VTRLSNIYPVFLESQEKHDIYWTDESQGKHDIYWTDESQEKYDIYIGPTSH